MHFFNLIESKKAFNVKNRKEAVRKYRKIKTIETIKKTPSPSFSTLENLYTEVFGYKSREEYVEKYREQGNGNQHFERSLRNYFKRLFDGLLVNEIIEQYKS